MENGTGIRQMIVAIVKACITQTAIIEGEVKNTDPLKVSLTNDKKMTLGKYALIVPERLNGKLDEGDRLHLLVTGNGGQYYVLDKA